MSKIKDLNHFATNLVKMDMRRSKFNLSHSVKTTFNSGKLIPILCQEVLPDDTFKIDLASVVRSITPAVPVMDNFYIDFYGFWVPSRLTTVHEKDWQMIHGENTTGFWAPSTESTLENTGNTFILGDNGSAVQVQSLAQYLGFPVGFFHSDMSLSRLKFNGYWEIWNEWFRDQNTQAPIQWKSYSNSDFVSAVSLIDSNASSGVMSVNKVHDYFTSVLPAPQKGSSVLLPLGDTAPVLTASSHLLTSSENPMLLRNVNGSTVSSGTLGTSAIGQLTKNATALSGTLTQLYPSNLYADLSQATAGTVNQLRQAFAIQKLLEKDARGGTRYREMLKVHFNVSIPDNTVQVPEYLGGVRVPGNMLQVLQTSENGSSPLGTTGAFSNTSDSSHLFTKSFAEYGFVYVLMCIRPLQSYSQGVPRDFTRNRRYDWYYPVFANLGEMAVMETEIYANDSSDLTEIFGYQEAWADLRYIPNRITGYLASNSGDTVAQSWTYSNRFTAKPVLNSSFMVQDKSNIDNTLVVQNSTYQFIGDFYFDFKAWRAMPYFSIPGLIDHH